MNPTLSICIPTYNDCQMLMQSLDEILRQIDAGGLYGDIEVVLSDNCSSDGTEDAVAAFVQGASPLLHFRYNRNAENIGLFGNVMNLVSLAGGNFIHLLGSDDFYVDGALSRLVAVCKCHSDVGFISLPYNFLHVYDNRTQSLQNDIHQDRECNTAGEFFKFETLRSLTLSSCLFSRQRAKVAMSVALRSRWPHISLMMAMMTADFHSFVMTMDTPMVTVRLGNQGWGAHGAMPYYIEVLKLYLSSPYVPKMLLLETFRHGIFCIEARRMKCDSLLENLRCAAALIALYKEDLHWAMPYALQLITRKKKALFCRQRETQL